MDKKPYPSETQDRFIIRLPEGLRARIAEAAKASGRSMNAEFVKRLEDSFSKSDASFNSEELLEGLLPDWIIKSMREGAAKRKLPLFAELLLRLEMFDQFMASKEARDEFSDWATQAFVKTMSVEDFARLKDQMKPPPPPEKKPAASKGGKRKLDVD